jgi:glycosyltransferase involved in cell wall biosynthesis
MQNADAVVFPTLYEGFGLPVAEAVLRGLPVIASDLPPIREQLTLFNCADRVRLVPPGDVVSLAQALTDFAAGLGPKRKSVEEMAPRFLHWTWSDAAETVVQKLRAMTLDPPLAA